MTEEATFVPGPDAARDFRDALGRFATGVTVVTCEADGPLGITANSFASVSLDPPLVLWSPARGSRRFDAFAGARHFAIHVLGAEQEALGAGFSSSGEAFEGLELERNAEGVPLIAGCLARFECRAHAPPRRGRPRDRRGPGPARRGAGGHAPRLLVGPLRTLYKPRLRSRWCRQGARGRPGRASGGRRMAVLLGVLRPLAWINDRLLAVARAVSVVLLGLMVLAILVQVFFRYALGSALPWPEESARFGMLWLVGLMAPVGYRHGGFVAIDMLERALPPRLGAALVLALALVALVVLVYALPLSSDHVRSGCLFRSSTLWIPFTLELALPLPGTGLALTLCGDAPSFALEPGWIKLPLAATYASLYVGLQLLLMVNVELLLRMVGGLLGGEERMPALRTTDMASAE